MEAIDFITNVMEENDEDSTIEDEWKYIALIIGPASNRVVENLEFLVSSLIRPFASIHLLLFRILWFDLLLLEY